MWVVPTLIKMSFPEAVVCEGAEELTLRRGEEGGQRTFIATTHVGGGQQMETTAGGRGLA